MFWSDYPWWEHLSPSLPFRSCSFEHPPVPLPHGLTSCCLTRITSLTPSILDNICTFLYTYFSSSPRLLFTPETLLTDKDHLFVILDKGVVIGTIRYHFIGALYVSSSQYSQSSQSSQSGQSGQSSPSIHIVDAFCIHPSYRKRGIGTYLLTELHRYANRQGLPCAMFLKEGPALPLLPFPLYSGCYVYRRILSPSCSRSILSLTPEQAHQWVSIYMTCQPQTLMILNGKTPNQCWKAYRDGTVSILACIQDTYQQVNPNERMGWVTVWLESPNVTDSIRKVASLALSNSITDYDWLWMNRKWTGYSHQEDASPWQKDGGFHWYNYQFTTCLSMETSYGIMT